MEIFKTLSYFVTGLFENGMSTHTGKHSVFNLQRKLNLKIAHWVAVKAFTVDLDRPKKVAIEMPKTLCLESTSTDRRRNKVREKNYPVTAKVQHATFTAGGISGEFPVLSLRFIVPEGKLWLMGTFSILSFDSRYFGAISADAIIALANPLLVRR